MNISNINLTTLAVFFLCNFFIAIICIRSRNSCKKNNTIVAAV